MPHGLVQNGGAAPTSAVQKIAPVLSLHSPPPMVQYSPTPRSLPGAPGATHVLAASGDPGGASMGAGGASGVPGGESIVVGPSAPPGAPSILAVPDEPQPTVASTAMARTS